MKTIMISDETYEKLSSIKGEKSFTILLSELVDELKQMKNKDIMRFAGIMSDKEADEMQRSIRETRKRARARI